MPAERDQNVKAILGPTNTGKTHLAVERLCAHSSGIMGFPLRLLAREIYDRVVAIKGVDAVGLVTGEEKILPPKARWLLCTAESMPMDRDVAFVALDEAQLGADKERGHIFTDRLLNARGREETMILGSESLRPMIRALIPDAEITTRPRFSKLSYAGSKKLSRLPPRSAVVTFSAQDVYRVAEILRQERGGAAVVMGSLSPRARNAQVAMYQSGEVDYLVATDAIGMGLNLDVGHVAFAGLTKFDGKRQRRLMLSEMAQIAGRAGRHHRDGTFGTLRAGPDGPSFTDTEIERIENHSFPKLDALMWRNPDPDFSSVTALIASLEEMPPHDFLHAAPEVLDITALKILSGDTRVQTALRQGASVARLWDVCGVPDFRKVGADHHARLLTQLYGYLGSGSDYVPVPWFASELVRLDNVQGDVETIAARLAAVRTWTYVAQRPNWLADPQHWAARAADVEERLSDTLHHKLTERFVDRRTTILRRSKDGDPAFLDVTVDPDGVVAVEEEVIGHLAGFHFSVDPSTRSAERRKLLAAAELRLPLELSRRVHSLHDAADDHFSLNFITGEQAGLTWVGHLMARLKPGKSLLEPRIRLEPSVKALPVAERVIVEARLGRWLHDRIAQRMSSLLRFQTMLAQPTSEAPLRAILAQLVENGGKVSRFAVDDALAALDPQQRRLLAKRGLVIGSLDIFHPAMLKPEAVKLYVALKSAQTGVPLLPLPMPGLGLLDQPEPSLVIGAEWAGFRRFGNQMLRIDLVEKIARTAHDARGKSRIYAHNPDMAVSLGIGTATLGHILKALGFHPILSPKSHHWRWRGRPRAVRPTAPINNAFSDLRAWQNPSSPDTAD